jgi:hypothetical protein
MLPPPLRRLALILLLLPALAGCERLVDQLDLPDPKKEAIAAEAEGKAIGSACRHAGRSLEDCYVVNPSATKASVFTGWKEMNDYMTQNNIEVVPSKLPASLVVPRAKPEPANPDAHADTPHTEAPHAAPPAEEAKPAEEAPRRRLRRSNDH